MAEQVPKQPADFFLTVGKEGRNRLTFERSRFLGHAKKIYSEDQAKEFVREIRENYSDATHNCCAYVCGVQGEQQFADDHGEPSGSAGRPILGAILALGLTNVCVVITRYYGGKKLGIRGLIDAYGTTARTLLEECGFRTEVLYQRAELRCDYGSINRVCHLLETSGGRITEKVFLEEVRLVFAIRQRDYREVAEKLAVFARIRPL